MIAALAAAVLWQGCSNTENTKEPEPQYGEKESICLNVNFKLEGIETKTVNERLIENVNLYITDQLGALVHHGYYTGAVNLGTEVYDNMEYTVYAVANAGKKMETGNAEGIEALTYSIQNISQIASPGGAVLMCGKSDPQKLDKKATITISLTRCIAKVVIQADYSGLYDDVEIQVNKVQLRNVPSSTRIFAPNSISNSSEAMNGEIVLQPSGSSLKQGIAFYQFENLQGTLQPENTSQQEKQWPQGSRYEGICSYVEMQATYSSPRKYGNILYRFYLGKDMLTNYDVERNTQLNITVNFQKDGAVDENTWRVDNSDIQDLVTGIELSPQELAFTELGVSRAIAAEVHPSTAYNCALEWASTNSSVAEVDAYGNVTSAGNGSCRISATSTDGTNITAWCNVTVNWQAPPAPPAKVEVTGITVLPDNLSLVAGQTATLQATVSPENATDKGVQWSSSDNSIATVDSYGKVTAKGAGNCTIYATSTSKPAVQGMCAVTVTAPAPDAKLEFLEKSLNMYDGQSASLAFVANAPSGSSVVATSSNTGVVKIVETGVSGVQIEAVAPGSATISAGIGEANHTTCTITVEKLRIVPQQQHITMYNHFYEDVEYTVYPTWAAKDFQLKVSSGERSMNCGYEGLANRVIPQYGQGADLPVETAITLQLVGREDVSAQVTATVKPMVALAGSLKINANMGNSDVVKDLGIDTHLRADVSYSWAEADGIQFYGSPGAGNVEISKSEGKIIFPIPNSANGLYRLIASVTGDDGYGASGESDARSHCDITIYETIYLVGISKTVDRSKVPGEQHTWKYENEVVAKWLAHPRSLKYPQGEVALDLPFSYKGQTFTDSHTGITEEYTFTFTVGEAVEMALTSDTFTYNGTAPLYYLEYFRLEPAGSAYMEGNPATGEPYVYVYSRHFTSGFSKSPAPDWNKIFEIVYP